MHKIFFLFILIFLFLCSNYNYSYSKPIKNKKAVKKLKKSNQIPSENQETTSNVPIENFVKIKANAVVINKGLLRKTPSPKAAPVLKINPGQKLLIVGTTKQRKWYQVLIKTKKKKVVGWVGRKFININKVIYDPEGESQDQNKEEITIAENIENKETKEEPKIKEEQKTKEEQKEDISQKEFKDEEMKEDKELVDKGSDSFSTNYTGFDASLMGGLYGLKANYMADIRLGYKPFYENRFFFELQFVPIINTKTYLGFLGIRYELGLADGFFIYPIFSPGIILSSQMTLDINAGIGFSIALSKNLILRLETTLILDEMLIEYEDLVTKKPYKLPFKELIVPRIGFTYVF